MLTPNTRLPGLDLLRSIAIILVLWDHGIRFLPPNIFGEISPFPLLDGVDLFFVLSGWLVTRHLYSKSQHIDFRTIRVFYISRWLRTLPAYWVVLIINIILLAFGIIPGLVNYNAGFYFIFLQNFHQPLDLFFWESWSLSVEEWFYIGFPFVLFMLLRVLRIKNNFLLTCLLFIVIGILCRNYYFQLDPNLSADLYFRKLVICRIDMIAWGGLAYYLYQHKYLKPSLLLTFIGLLVWITSEKLPNEFFVKVLKYSINGFAISLMMPWVSNLTIHIMSLKKILERISKLSYSIYLVHLGIVAGLISYILPQKSGFDVWLLYIISSTAIASLLYFSIEKPFLAIRNKWIANKVNHSLAK